MTTDIQITGELTPDPSVCIFRVNRPVVDDMTIQFRSREEGQGSILIDKLFDIDGICQVLVSGPKVALTKNVTDTWPQLVTRIVAAIKESMADGVQPISREAIDAVLSQPTGEIEALVTELFESHINPALSSHGGYVRLVKVQGHDVHVEMGGGCQGCAASQATLKYGIESAIREAAPQVRDVIDVTDHASGDNPYYK
ncbi:MAG: NifU family protein [Verrucomicrobia bacterium]|nr:NifU family protein [Verrucomicrobiota bacterium]